MKRHWETDELIDSWTLLPPERELLGNKSGATRLGFAVLLKFFESEGRFPRTKSEIPASVIDFIAGQMQVDSNLFSAYDWQARSASYHRQQIRQLFNSREAAAEDAECLSRWLNEKIFPFEYEDDHILTKVYRQFRRWRIEPPTYERIERIVRSSRRLYDEEFCRQIQSRLSPETQGLLESLLLPEDEHTFRESENLEETKFLRNIPLAAGISSEPSRDAPMPKVWQLK